MRNLTKTHFTLVRVFSLIAAILNFIGIIPVVIYSVLMIFSLGQYRHISYYSTGLAYSGLALLVFGLALTITFGCLLIKVTKLYKEAAKMDDEFLKENKGRILGWGIFFAIVMSPSIIGFIASLVLSILANNYIQGLIDGREEDNRSFGQKVKTTSRSIVRGTKEVFVGSDEEKQEDLLKKLRDLKQMKEDGLIDEDEYAVLRKKTLGL